MHFLLNTVFRPLSFAVIHHHWLPFHVPVAVQPMLALVAGLLILIRPKFLNFIVAVYLIIVGLIGLSHLV